MLHSRRSDSDFVKAYKSYAFNPNIESQSDLLDACFAYDFSRYDIDMKAIKNIHVLLKNKELNECIELNSNGSMGEGSRYALGPYGHNLIRRVEEFQRRAPTNELFRLSTFYPYQKNINTVMSDMYVVVDLFSSKCVDFISEFIKENPNKTHVEVSPEIFMMMCCQDHLLDYLNQKSIRVITTGGDAYRSSAIRAEDRMIDWKTGCNFYECEKGEKHILPLWFEKEGTSHNILNLREPAGHEVSDFMEIKGFSDCECGGKKCDFTIVSHFMHKPKFEGKYIDKESILEKVKGKYMNFQLLFDELRAQVLTCEFKHNPTHEEDFVSVKNQLKSMGFRVSLKRGFFARLGRKRPIIWSGTEKMAIDNFE